MYETKKPIGVLGGTFDPIHLGHLRMALELYENLNLSKVHFIPCYQPVHRKMPIASALDRFNMVKLAVNQEKAFYADDREIKRQNPSYTIDTLLEFKQETPDLTLCLFLGIDAFLGFNTWQRYEEILNYAHIIIAHRPQYELPKSGIIADLLNKHLQHDVNFIHQHDAGGILLQTITPLEISASEIRKQISSNKNPKYLLPVEVYDYIKERRIYRPI